MIARHWRGWTAPENANAYEDLLRDTVLSGLSRSLDIVAVTYCGAA
jgi:hypothetical protein